MTLSRDTTENIPKVADLLKNGGRCSLCGYVYQKRCDLEYGSNNGSAHRYHHRQHVPLPDPRLVAFPSGDIRVDRKSQSWLNQLVYSRARYLRRQEQYDFTQWDEDHGLADNENEKNIHALLLVEPPQIIIGAASFSWMLWKDYRPGWHLNFVWIAGTWRRKGMLSKRWLTWKETYGAFTVEPPWSDDMHAFLRSAGPPDPRQAERLKEMDETLAVKRLGRVGPDQPSKRTHF